MAITTAKRRRLTIDIPLEVKRRLRLISVRRDISMREYVLQALEGRLAEYCGCAAAVAVSSGTDALLCSLIPAVVHLGALG